MATMHQAETQIDGKWNVTWRPALSAPQSATLTLTTDGTSLFVRLDTPGSSTECEGVVDGHHVVWTVTLDDGPGPLRFEANVQGDELAGQVQGMGGVPGGGWASFEGVRAGSSGTVQSREGSDAVADTLVACGVEYIFGFPGGMTTSLERSIISHQIPDVGARNELSAAWMSYGYNRVKRRAASGVLLWCVGTSHATPVVHAAKLDSTPLLVMAVESTAAWDMRDILQDATDLYSVLKPLAKYIKRIVDGEDLPLAVRQAVIAASTGKAGPAVLDLTQGAMYQRTTVKTEALTLPAPPAATEDALVQALEMIKDAKRPVVLAGAGIHLADARSELRAFVEATGTPVVSSGPGGRGVLPDDHPLYAGDMSPWGYFATGLKMAEEADLWIAIGFSFSQSATLSWSIGKPEKVIHVDIAESQIGRIFQPSLGIVADAKTFLSQMSGHVAASGIPTSDGSADARLAEIAQTKERYFEKLRSFVGADPIMPAAIGQVLADEVPEGTLLVNDEGFMVPGMVYRESKYPSGFAPPLGFHYASLGSTLPVAIGAKFAAPDRLVVCVGGDGGFHYECADLSVLAENNLRLVFILVNNGGLYGGRRGRARGGGAALPDTHWTNFPEMDYATIARGFGVPAERVEKADELVPAIQRAMSADGPYFVEVLTGGSSMHLHLGAIADDDAMSLRKFGHGDLAVAGSWPN